jgi:tetratricopeptide (TPR) repeat protein
LLRERPDLDFLYLRAGIFAVKTNRMAEAVTHYQRYLQTDPANFKARNNLATALSRLGKIDQAIDQWQQVVSQNPDYFKAHTNLAAAFSRAGRLDEAICYWQKAVKLKPDSIQAHLGLAETFYRKGKLAPAIKQWGEVLKLRPGYAKIQNDLAWVLATQENAELRNPPEAVRLARSACELTKFNQPGYLDTLAAAYAADGRFDKAVETAKNAIAMASSAGQNTLAGNIQNRLLLYHNGQAYFKKSQPPQNTQPKNVDEKD